MGKGVDKSPLYQYLPTCNDEDRERGELTPTSRTRRIVKKTDSRALLCPMFKDEEGFLSEFVAYYQVQGFDHIMFFDDGSTDKSSEELKPWIDAGVVSMRYNWTMDRAGFKPHPRTDPYMKAMVSKALMERECKRWGIENGYHYFLSVDMDEYVMPLVPRITLVDAFEGSVLRTGRVLLLLDKYNYPSTPHILEPVDLLTIEAYQTRVKIPNRMNYYTTVGRKVMLMLQPPPSFQDSALGLIGWNMSHPRGLDSTTALFMADCCNFHGCNPKTPGYLKASFGHRWCENLHKEPWQIIGKGKKWEDVARMNHYSRSLEKFELKGKTWKTSTGEIKEGMTREQAAASYDLNTFFQRSVGWFLDRTALRYSCQVRETLRNYTREEFYLRPGEMWYRNPEFGKEVSIPGKRGRYGRPLAQKRFDDGNLYHYHGHGQKGGLDASLPG